MKIFVSSVMQGYEEFREAAFSAIVSLDHELIRAEDFPSSTSSSRVACLQGVRQADLVVLILGERYGWSETQSGLSPTHEEFREAADQGKVIPFVQAGVEREPQQSRFVAELEDYDSGNHRGRTFATPDELRIEVTRAISRHQLAAATTPVDVSSMISTARALIPEEDGRFIRSTEPLLNLAVVGGPSQTMIRPSEIEQTAFIENLIRDLSGSGGYFSYRHRTQHQLDKSALVVQQENGAGFRIDEAGAMLLSVPIEQAQGHLKPLIEGHVHAALDIGLTFADRMLENIDPTQKLTRLVICAGAASNSVFGWKTAAELAASPNSGAFQITQPDDGPVLLNPADRARASLRTDRGKIAEDLLALIRRQHRG